MKIVMMIDWFLYYTVELVNALSREHQVMLITRDHNFEISSADNPVNLDEFLDECLDGRVVREKLRYRLGNIKSFPEMIRIYKEIRKFDPNVIHVQENSDWRILLLAALSGFSKVVLTVHDVVRHPGDTKNIMRVLSRYFRKKVKRIIVHGEYLKEQLLLKSKKFKNKIWVVPLGAFSLYKKWDDSSVKTEENSILFFGRISEYKGIDVLVKAEPLIAQEIPDIKIIVAGRGEDICKYGSHIMEHPHFEIHDRFIADHEVPLFFRRASLVILPYKEASQSAVIPIAYLFGKPVVVSDVGSIPEVVEQGRTGFIVSPDNPQDLADAIVKILKNPELKRSMSQNVAQKLEMDLSPTQIARKTTEVYASL